MRTYRNAGTEHRVWSRLRDPRTGRTLGLAPGETVDLDLPDDFHDPHLLPADAKAPRSRKPPSEPAAPAVSAEES